MKKGRYVRAVVGESQWTIRSIVHIADVLQCFAAIDPWTKVFPPGKGNAITKAILVVEHQDQPAAGLEHTVHFGQGRARIGNVMQDAHRTGNVKGVVWERQLDSINLPKIALEPAECEALFRKRNGSGC